MQQTPFLAHKAFRIIKYYLFNALPLHFAWNPSATQLLVSFLLKELCLSDFHIFLLLMLFV